MAQFNQTLTAIHLKYQLRWFASFLASTKIVAIEYIIIGNRIIHQHVVVFSVKFEERTDRIRIVLIVVVDIAIVAIVIPSIVAVIL